MAGAREVVITYGDFDTTDTGCTLTGVHTLDQDERTFKCVFDVVYQASSAAVLLVRTADMITALNQRHQDLKIVIGGTTYFHFVDGINSPSGTEEGSEFIKADWKLLGSHRTAASRAYQITLTVTRSAKQTNKLGVYDQTIRVMTLPTGRRRMTFRAQFTPGPSAAVQGNAATMYAHGTYGFAALVAAIQTTLTGTWERSGSITQSYDEDSRTLTASASYTELIFDQSADGTDDSTLVNARYDIKVDRGSAFTLPGQLGVQPLTAVTILFSSAVDKAVSTDLKTVIDSKVIPYCTNTVNRKLLLQSSQTPILLKHSLRADYVSNRVAGALFYLVKEGSQVLELSKRISDVGRVGVNYVPVLDGTQFPRDKHTGPGMLVRRVVLGTRVLGLDAGVALDSLEDQEHEEQTNWNFRFTGYAENSSPSVENFKIGSGSVTTTVQTRVLEYEYAEVRSASTLGSSVGVGSTRARGADGSSGQVRALKRFSDEFNK